MSETEVTADMQIVNDDDLDAFTADFFGEKPVEPSEAKPEAEQEAEEGDTEAQNTELTDQDEAEAEAELAKPKPKSKVQERIDELVKQREETKREADAKIEAIRKEFEDFKKANTPEKPAVKTDEPTPEDVLESGDLKYPLGEFDPAYIRDLTKFVLAQERTQANIQAEQERVAKEQQLAQEQLTSSWNEKVVSAKEKYPDLAEKGEKLLAGFSGLNTDYAGYLSTVIMSMDYGPDVLYYLSNNPDEATKIVNSGAQKATLALGRIEAKFAEAEQTKQSAKPKVSKAPPPPTATARGTGGGVQTVEPDTDDLDAFTREFFRKKA